MFGLTIVPEFTDKIEITIIANNFKEGLVESTNETLIKKDSTKISQERAKIEKEEGDVYPDIDIPPFMRNNRR